MTSELVPLDVAELGGACGVVIVGEGRSCPEALSALASSGAHVLWGHVESGERRETCHAYFVFSDCQLESLEDRLRRMEGVTSVRVEKAGAGGAGSLGIFPIMAGGVRAVILREDIAAGLMEGIVGKLGDSTWFVLLYHIGREYGRAAYKRHVLMSGSTVSAEKLLRLAEAMFRVLGYGILEQEVDVDSGIAIARIKESFECRILGAMGRRGRTSQFFRGTLSGWFSEFFGGDVKCEETACINEGAPYCEFECRMPGGEESRKRI